MWLLLRHEIMGGSLSQFEESLKVVVTNVGAMSGQTA